MNSGPSGFDNAPVTKAAIALSACFSIVGSCFRVLRHLNLSYSSVFQRLELWRLLTAQFAFSSLPEAAFGLYLLYVFRMFERLIGSSKFGVFVLFSVVTSTILQLCGLLILRGDALPSNIALSPGLYSLIFSLFVPFCFDIPVSSRFSIFGLRLTNKTLVYLAGLQLLLSSGKSSFLTGMTGVLAGLTYRTNVFSIKTWKLPNAAVSWVVKATSPFSFFANYSLRTGRVISPRDPSVLAPPLAVSSYQSLPGNDSERAAGRAVGPLPPFLGGGARSGFSELFLPSLIPPPPPPTPPPQEAVETLTGMGFDRSEVTRALADARNDVTLATDLLLEWRRS